MRYSPFGLTIAAALSLAACGPRDKDKLEDSELAGNSASSGEQQIQADSRCRSRSAADDVKRQLFARAAEIRGSNADNYAKIAEFALIDIGGAAPVAAVSAGELVDCRGNASVRLPAGLRVAGGRTALNGDVSFSVSPGAAGTVTLGQSDAITIPLATLTQNRRASTPEPAPTTRRADVSADAPSSTQPASPTVERPAPPDPRPAPTAARPSYDCRNARTSSEKAVCSDPVLANLDRTMASQYRDALASSAPEQRRLLVQTRDRFLAFRERCGSDSCIANAYRGRMREIDDIMAGRWRGR